MKKRNAWREFFDEWRLALGEQLLWLAVEVLPKGREKLEVGTFVLEYLRRRSAEMQQE